MQPLISSFFFTVCQGGGNVTPLSFTGSSAQLVIFLAFSSRWSLRKQKSVEKEIYEKAIKNIRVRVVHTRSKVRYVLEVDA